MTTAICPGSFDPITLGHLGIIKRTAGIFDEVVVCVMFNAEKKKPMFTVEEKVQMVQEAVKDLPNVKVDHYSGLLAEYVQKYERPVIIKGLRAMSDVEYEFQMNYANKRMNPNVETLFLPSSEKFTYLSSSIVRELAGYGADLSGLIPETIIPFVQERARQWR